MTGFLIESSITQKYLKYVNVDNFTSYNEGLKKCLEEFLENPTFKNINWRAEALKDRRQKKLLN
jgi:hypothetical protein